VNKCLNPSNTSDIYRLVSDYCRIHSLQAFPVLGPLTQEQISAHELLQKQGCYVIFNADGYVLYIGMSQASIEKRLAKHVSAPVQASPFWLLRPPPYLSLIIEVWNTWEAPSLEAYLEAHTTSVAGQPSALID
jgi:GIY-YIG catalytic domain